MFVPWSAPVDPVKYELTVMIPFPLAAKFLRNFDGA